MPLFPNLAELKGLANSLNPLNVFADQPPPNTTTTATSSPASPSDVVLPKTVPAPQYHTLPSAPGGPGPSTQAAAQKRAPTLAIPQSGSKPIRPSLKNGTSSTNNENSSSTSSLEDEAGRRRSSGASVVIIDPQDEERQKRVATIDGLPRRSPRTMSAVSGLSGAAGDGVRRKKKTPLDTYIVVRPPPTSSKNPMNLQIQLVVKETRLRDRSVSGVSLRAASISTDATSSASAPATPTRPTIDLPPPDSISQVVDLSSSTEPKSPRCDSPTRLSSDDNDVEPEAATGSALRRSSSLKSSLSSATSGTSSTSGGSRKRVEPMFNLAVHNVMQPTVVTDAATDAKVAKFLKRSLDVNGVGILEPSEVWLPASNTNSFTALPGSALGDDAHPTARSRPVSMISTLTAPLSPTATRVSDSGAVSSIRNSLDVSFKRTSMDLKNARLEVAQEGGAKKFFGKIFKKKGQAELAPPSAEPRRSISLAVKRSPSPPSENGEGSNMTLKAPPGHSIVTDSHNHSVGHPTFGTAPMVIRRRSSGTIVTPDGAVTGLTAPSVPVPITGLGTSPETSFLAEKTTTLPMLPSSRPVGYTWSVKKWAKKNSDGWAAHLVAAASAGLELVHGTGGEGDDEVIFEWVKLRVPSNAVGNSIMRRYSTNGAIAVAPGSRPKSRRPKSRTASIRDGALAQDPDGCLSVTTPDTQASSLPPSPNPSLDARPRPVRRISASVSPAPARRSASRPPSIIENDADHDASSIHTYDMTAEEDSDPEDSETPWTCSIWVKKTGQRQLLGTLTPAPHHPKVVAALKIPRTLEPVSLAQVKEGTGMVQKEMATRVRQEVCLTEENLKDVVCVTAMWLVAREEFNGLGRKKRGGSKV